MKDSYKLILGIDPGKGGGIAVIDHKKGASAMKFPKELGVLSAMIESFMVGYKAKDIVWDYDCSYNVGTSITYLLRCQRKHSSPIECIEKAIHHLEFELEQLKNEGKKS